MKRVALSVLAAAALCGTPAFAHHPFASEFDASKPIMLTGNVTKLDWVAPHVTIHVMAKEGDGPAQEWTLEGPSPDDLKKAGVTKASLKVGESVTAHGYRAKSEANTANVRRIEAGGKSLSFFDPTDGGPKT
jgi:hypothetical protein